MTSDIPTSTTEQPQPTGLRARFNAYLAAHKEMERFLKFAVVGVIGAVIDSGTFNGLQALGWLDDVNLNLGLFSLTGIGIAGTIAFMLAVTSNFIWNRYWTYPDSRTKSLWSQLVTFFLINIVGILIRIPILELGSAPLSRLVSNIIPTLNPDTAAWLGANMAWAIAVVIVMFWNFFVNRYWTYNDVS